jgi:uncharacterized protein (DUF433 family)
VANDKRYNEGGARTIKREPNAMTIPKELENVLASTPGMLSGAVRFQGTRVPVQALLDTLEDGDGLDEFLEGWPNVPREYAEAVVRWEQSVARKTFGIELDTAR